MISSSTSEARRLRRWQGATVALLFLGYGGYYFCRSNLSVAMPMIIDELHAKGMDPGAARVRMGTVVSLAVFAYAIGKFVFGGIADAFGGKRNFVGGMAGAIVFTLVFAAGGSLPLFTLAWIGNRFVQAAGWSGLVKVTSRWFDFSSYGTIMGVLSISFLLGDAVARQSMAAMIASGAGWRSLFLFAAAVLLLLLLLNLLFLRESRTEIGAAPPAVNPLNLFGDSDTPARRPSVFSLLRRPSFAVICFLSLGTTLVRETFNTWTPTYFHDAAGFSAARASFLSSVFPLVGAASVLITGWLSDKLGPSGRSAVMSAGLVIAGVGLVWLGQLPNGSSGTQAVILIGVVAVGLIGPYSCLAGAMALDYGGDRAGAFTSGVIDGVGYLGAVLAGDAVAQISVSFGWQRAFVMLAVVCLTGALAAGGLFISATPPTDPTRDEQPRQAAAV